MEEAATTNVQQMHNKNNEMCSNRSEAHKNKWKARSIYCKKCAQKNKKKKQCNKKPTSIVAIKKCND